MHKMKRILWQLARLIDQLNEGCGRLTAWLILLLVFVISYDVVMRYLFQSGSVALQELEWHLFALIFLLGAAYTLKHDDHVRVDVLYRSRLFSPRQRAWIDLLGSLFFLLPFCLFIINASIPFVTNSFAMAEGSPDAGGLPYRFLLKAAIPFGFFLLMLQGVALMIRSAAVLCCPVAENGSENKDDGVVS